MPEDPYCPYDDAAVLTLPDTVEPGDYVIRLDDTASYDFKDLFGNMMCEKPFSHITIHYAE